MVTNAVWLQIDEEHIVGALQDAGEKLESAGTELLLDLSSVHRLDISALKAIEQLANAASGKGIKVVLRGANVDLYKVLKLAKLTPRFSFVV